MSIPPFLSDLSRMKANEKENPLRKVDPLLRRPNIIAPVAELQELRHYNKPSPFPQEIKQAMHTCFQAVAQSIQNKPSYASSGILKTVVTSSSKENSASLACPFLDAKFLKERDIYEKDLSKRDRYPSDCSLTDHATSTTLENAEEMEVECLEEHGQYGLCSEEEVFSNLEEMYAEYGIMSSWAEEEPGFSMLSSSLTNAVVTMPVVYDQSALIDASSVPLSRAESLQAAHEMVQQITDRLSMVTYQDRNEIIIELKHPPLFQGSTLTITEYHAEKKTFSLTFTQLSGEAELLVRQTMLQEELKQNLSDKGYFLRAIVVHPAEDLSTGSMQEEKLFDPQEDKEQCHSKHQEKNKQ